MANAEYYCTTSNYSQAVSLTMVAGQTLRITGYRTTATKTYSCGIALSRTGNVFPPELPSSSSVWDTYRNISYMTQDVVLNTPGTYKMQKGYAYYNRDTQYNTTYYGGFITITVLPASNCHVNVGGTWKDGKMYVNVNGTWKEGKPYLNVNGTWKEGK